MTPPSAGSQRTRTQAVLLHVSDTHISADPEDAPATRLSHLAQRVLESGLRPDAIVVTGDVSTDGSRRSYRRFLRTLAPVAERCGAALLPVMGNHDARTPFSQVLLPDTDPSHPLDAVDDVPTRSGSALRIIRLDTTIPGSTRGRVLPEQLDWLEGILADTPRETPAVLALHHPPLAAWQHSADAYEMDPHSRANLLTVVAGRSVRLILCGHVHLASTAVAAGIPVSIAGALSVNQDALATPHRTRTWVGGASVNVIRLDEDGVLVSPALVEPLPVFEDVDAV